MPTRTACPEEETLVLYLEGALEKRQEAVVRGHINECDVCRSVVADAVREPPAADDGMTTATDELLVGKYKLLDQLGAGGMGRVYRARHVALERDVAIKFLRGDLVNDATIVRRFEREARAAAALNSRHVVQILDIDWLPSGAPFIVMEYLDGCDLARLLLTRGPLPVAEAVRYVLEACLALAIAHERGIIHRDLKPHNLFLAKDGTRHGTIKVLDFGLAKTQPRGPSSLPTAAGLHGSPYFMSPEQINGDSVDPRTDIWSLGATLHMLLTGEPPFAAPNLYAMLERIVLDPAPRISTRRPDVPPLLDDIFGVCLRKNPNERFASVEALANAIRNVPQLSLAKRKTVRPPNTKTPPPPLPARPLLAPLPPLPPIRMPPLPAVGEDLADTAKTLKINRSKAEPDPADRLDDDAKTIKVR